MPNGTSIVQRLNQQAITGRSLGITANQHHGYRMHFEWEGAFGNRCFERRFPSYNSLLHFCVTWINGTPEGLCRSIIVREGIHENRGREFGRLADLMFTKVQFCRRLLPGLAQWP